MGEQVAGFLGMFMGLVFNCFFIYLLLIFMGPVQYHRMTRGVTSAMGMCDIGILAVWQL
jgi:hypothetical protein